METSGALSMTRCPVSSESAAPVREKAMLINSDTASRWRSVKSIRLLPPEHRVDGAQHALRLERLVDEAGRARLIDQRPRRGLDVGAGDDHARARVQLA